MTGPESPPATAASGKRPWKRGLLIFHVVAAIYVLPTFFFASEQFQPPHSRVSTYRMTATVLVDLIVAGWNLVYWFEGFYPRIFNLSPKVQALTGARVRIGFRTIEWDRSVGCLAALGLQLRFLGLLVVAFAIWGVLMMIVVTLIVAMNEGLGGVVTFYRGHR